jgi:hypothetical protein
MEDNMTWDSRRGWVRPKKGIVIRRIKPKDPTSLEDMKMYEEAEENEEWFNDWDNPNIDWKVGYNKNTNPLTKYEKFLDRENRFNRINFILNMIPFVRVEVIE